MSINRRFLIGLIGVFSILLSLGSSYALADTLEDAKSAYGAGEFNEAVTLLRPLVREENKDAAYLLARIYEQGDGVAKDIDEAKRLYQIAAKQGHEDAQQRLDIYEAQGDDQSVVIEWYLPAALEGDTEAQYNLGFMYETGWGVPVNDKEAVRWYRDAAEMQHDVAQLRLGMMTIVGVGTEQNIAAGVDLIRNAAENGNRIAEAIIQDIYDVGELTEEQSTRIIAGLRRMLDEGEAKTLATLRQSLRDVHKRKTQTAATTTAPKPPSSSTPKINIVETVTRKKDPEPKAQPKSAPSKPVAQKKSPSPDTHAAPKSKGNMFQFYTDGANRGDADAQYHLGVMYIKGDEIAKDVEEGVYWMKLSAEQGHELASTYMELWKDDIDEGSLNSSVAINWLKETGRQWNLDAIFKMGFLYEKGRGVNVNFKKAAKWYRFAAVEGHAEAKRRLGLINSGKVSPQDGITSIQIPGSGLAMSPFVIGAVLLFIAALLGIMLHIRKSKSLKMPAIQREEQEVFAKAHSAQGMEADDRKFFDELWSSAPEKGDKPKPHDKAGAKADKAGNADKAPRQDTAEKTPELSEVEKKLAKAVDDLININPDDKGEESKKDKQEVKKEPKEDKIDVEKIRAEKKHKTTPEAQTEKPAAAKPKKEAAPEPDVKEEKQAKVAAQKIAKEKKPESTEKPYFDVDAMEKSKANHVFGADDFMKNGISKDALASSRISADSLFADGVAIDEAGKAVGRSNVPPQKLNADAMLSINDLSLKGANTGKQKKPTGSDTGLLPKRSIEDEIELEVKEIHRVDHREEAPEMNTPLSQDEERSLAEVHYNIGVMFSNGDGVPKNEAQAAKWFLKAAEEGLPEAQFSVGQCYLSGTGLAKNTAMGMDWLQKAADNNFAPAIEMLKKRNQAI